MLAYSKNKYANLLQIIDRYFTFAQNVLKQCSKMFYKMGFLVTSKIFCHKLKANSKAVLQMLCNKVYNKRFFILYDNINFYKKYKINIYITKIIK